jgi:copper chaperone CopZ
MIHKSYRVTGMSCPNCAMSIESIEDELPGIRRLAASYQKGSMEIEYDENLVSESEILAAVQRRGYQAVMN